MIVMEALGGPRERIRKTTAREFDLAGCRSSQRDRDRRDRRGGCDTIPYAAGLPDSYFENDGQLTKREVRAVTLSSLQPCRGRTALGCRCRQRLDRHRMAARASFNRAIGIERDEARAARASRNAAALGVPHFDIRHGAAPDALAGLPEPDAIFIGGGSAAGGRRSTRAGRR